MGIASGGSAAGCLIKGANDEKTSFTLLNQDSFTIIPVNKYLRYEGGMSLYWAKKMKICVPLTWIYIVTIHSSLPVDNLRYRKSIHKNLIPIKVTSITERTSGRAFL